MHLRPRRIIPLLLAALLAAAGAAHAAQPARGAPDDARWSALYDQASAALARGDYGAAEQAARQALAEAERVLGNKDPDTAGTLSLLAAALDRLGRHAEAESLHRRALAIFESASGPQSADVAVALNNLALCLEKLGRYGDAEALLTRAVAIADKVMGPQHADSARMRGALARVLEAQGKHGATAALARPQPGGEAAALRARAEALARAGDLAGAAEVHRQVVAVLERSLGPQHPETATAISNLAHALYLQGALPQAEEQYRRALAIREKALGPDHPDTAVALNNLGNVLHEQGKGESRRAERGPGAMSASARYSEAEALFQRALAINEKVLGGEHPATATALNNLAVVQESLGRYDEAQALHRRALAIREKALGPDHPDTALSLTNLSLVLDRQGQIVEAEALHRKAVEAARKTGDPRALLIHASRLGYALASRGRLKEALPFYLESLDTLDALYAQTRGLAEETRQGFLAQFRDVYAAALGLLARLHRAQPEAGYDRQALAVASRNQSRLFSELLRQADVARFSGEPAFAALKGELDQRGNRLAELRLERAALPPGDAGASRRRELEAALAAERSALGDVTDRLWRDYPRFMELTRPRPVTVEDLQQRLLRPGEALLTFAALEQESLVFAVTREQFRMAIAPLSRRALAARVREVRRPLEQVAAGAPLPLLRLVDPAALNALYRDLVAPVDGVLQRASRVLVVADAALATLPLEMLVTRYGEPERARFEQARRGGGPLLEEYAGLAWLGQRQHFSYLPSLAALVSQRQHAVRGEAWRRTLTAFADPLFPGEQAGADAPLPRLPDTAQEAREIAAVLGGESMVLVRAAAQERTAKSGALQGSRYLLFATHGLLAGEFLADGAAAPAPGGLKAPAQPALALTLTGDLGGEDGFLTLREVIESLHIDAEVVALSACNTAGETEAARNGEGFAGLTRAFMYAGARYLVVSHWSVESAATRMLMTETFRRLKAGDPPETALAQARGAVMATQLAFKGSSFSRAHPFFWAPFVLVGD